MGSCTGRLLESCSSLLTVQETADTLHVCVLVGERICWRLHCVTLPFSTDEIRCLSARASHQALTGSAADAYSDIFRDPPPVLLRRRSSLLSISVWINIIYISVRKDKPSILFFVSFFSHQFLQTKLVLLLCTVKCFWSGQKTLTCITDHRVASTFKNTVFFLFSVWVTFFLPPTTSPCAPWKSSGIWTETLRAQPNAGRSLWSPSVQKKRNSRRNGRTKPRSRDCAWWGSWGPTVWRMPWGKKWGRFAPWSVTDLLLTCCLTKG